MVVRTKEKVGQPGCIVTRYIDNWKIQHINDFAMQPACITAAFREQSRQLRKRAFAENLSVKHTVDDVSNGTGSNQ